MRKDTAGTGCISAGSWPKLFSVRENKVVKVVVILLTLLIMAGLIIPIISFIWSIGV